MPQIRFLVLAALMVLAVGLVGCGDDGDDDPEEPTPTPEETPAEPEPEAEPTPTPEPETAQEVYEVQSGDTLWSIADQFGTTVDAIVEANDLDDPDAIFVGDELVIPVEADED